MKPITENALRLELRNSQPEVYYVPTGCMLTPAAREYLQQRKIKIAKEGETVKEDGPRVVATEVPPMPQVTVQADQMKPKFVDYETGAYYMTKPEHMTHLFGNTLVNKNHPRILFRGKLDSLQALVVLDQVLIGENGSEKLVADLDNILGGGMLDSGTSLGTQLTRGEAAQLLCAALEWMDSQETGWF